MKPNEGIASWLVMLLAVMAGVSVANLYYCQPLLNLIREDMGLTEFQVNLMPVCTQVGYAVGLLFIVPMGDLYNRRTTITACFSCLIVALCGIALTRNVALLLVASLATGFCSVAPQVFIPFVTLYAEPKEKARKAGFVLTGLLCGILGSRVVSGYVGNEFGWRCIYGVAAVAIFCSAVLTLRFFPSVEPTYKGGFGTLMASIASLSKRHPRALLYSVRSALTFGSMLGMWACLAFRMAEAPFHVGSDTVGLLGLCGVAGALTASNVGRYVPRYGVERINMVGAVLVLVAWSIMGLFHNTYAGMVAGIVIIDIGMQCVQLSNQTATIQLSTEASSRMNTIYMTTYFIGGSFGTFLAGTLWSQFGWSGTVAAGAGMVVLAIVLTLMSNALKGVFDKRNRSGISLGALLCVVAVGSGVLMACTNNKVATPTDTSRQEMATHADSCQQGEQVESDNDTPLSATITEDSPHSSLVEQLFNDMVYVEGDTLSFYICKYEVTQKLWVEVMGSNPSEMQGDDLPVEQVSWNDCQRFITKLNELTGKKYRLPTEAEWEYACRGGKYSKGYEYSGSDNLDEVAWYSDNSDGKSHPVGEKQPNELGLYDMSGNVWEWCQDLCNSSRVCRGGSWIHNARNCQPSLSNETPQSFYINSLGLRLAL